MTTAPVVIVAGLGRCGSSLTMQMLAAGGLRCAGAYPDFEDERTLSGQSADWWRGLAGSAVKVLTPHHVFVPIEVPKVVIWLDRDLDHQASSQIKMLELTASLHSLNRSQRRAWRNGLEKDRAAALHAVKASKPRSMLRLSFERLLADPRAAADLMSDHLLPVGLSLDVAAAAAQVLPRGPACAPGLEIEQMLMGAAA